MSQLSMLRLSDGSSAADKLHTPSSSVHVDPRANKSPFPNHKEDKSAKSRGKASSQELNVLQVLKNAGVDLTGTHSPPAPSPKVYNEEDILSLLGKDLSPGPNLMKSGKFFVTTDILDSAPIDNFEATSPIIRTLPTLKGDGRYIIVGDVHGCVDQLRALVDRVKFRKGTDLLIIIGDFVNKGPDSVGVVRYCQEMGALGVLGNHDYTLLSCIDAHRKKPTAKGNLKDPVKRLAMDFPHECEVYLRSLPHILKLPKYNVILVHAGLNFQRKLEKQDVMEIMHMRKLEEVSTLDPNTGRQKRSYVAVAKGPTGQLWGSMWEGPEHVVFGHDASTGFQTHPFATGIDTGCVYGDPLTCVIFSGDKKEGAFVSVPGLPKYSNEKLGLPPPDSAVYEEFEDLEKKIFRPTPRTPSLVGGVTPVFLATPPALTNSFANSNKLQSLTTVKASPLSLAPSAGASPPSSSSSVVQETLLTLANAHQIRAIGKLSTLSAYDNELNALSSSPDVVSKFWLPFSKQVLSHIASSTEVGDGLKEEEEALCYVFSACDESAALLSELKPLIRSLRYSGTSQKQWSKSTVKYMTVLLEE
ncbi:ser/thr protein phosphatase [Angomonas deanei]|uniref:Calcineurin-like phosphoesterase, putative n=1 Tax=Angomonas deanei TaxID=59799 RepID=A0A7G2CMB2_9TRYP|nr:ser/thr protein phosphatase [Angomonas deanei]CAD2220565.1 Calcineurin-like phosphoesterase, putative [Angomonas deanei]|eukprot:EPY21696.1 ser/thr protein phosphatase [Angomonas deanei]